MFLILILGLQVIFSFESYHKCSKSPLIPLNNAPTKELLLPKPPVYLEDSQWAHGSLSPHAANLFLTVSNVVPAVFHCLNLDVLIHHDHSHVTSRSRVTCDSNLSSRTLSVFSHLYLIDDSFIHFKNLFLVTNDMRHLTSGMTITYLPVVILY